MPNDLTGRELDAAIAVEVFGMVVTGPTTHPMLGPGWFWDERDKSASADPEPYSTDANAARLVLAEIERRGLNAAFLDVLDNILWPEPTAVSNGDAVMAYLKADPKDLGYAALVTCRAALAACRGGKK